MVATEINKEACPCGVVWPFVRAWQHFHVAGQNFEEVATPTLIKKFKQNKQTTNNGKGLAFETKLLQ